MSLMDRFYLSTDNMDYNMGMISMSTSNCVFCVGCGLCQACSKAELQINDKGFSYPVSGEQEWLDKVCPIGNLPAREYDDSTIWGRSETVCFGWSNNPELRMHASSGGIISEIACYLLKTGQVDGVIHVCADTDNQTTNNTTISYSREDVIKKAGSRYSISHPLDIIRELDPAKKYAFIGKPCDVVALRNYQEMNPENIEIVPILLSFFCMGLPSVQAQEKLLKALDSDISRCKSLTYRGNGWPGYATVVNKDGTSVQIDYDSSWGKILGRDLMPACRFCLDGIGEAADISCGDAWYIGDNGKPDFSEHEGRNVVFARTPRGLDIINDMINEGTATFKKVEDPEAYLPRIQRSQFFRRASMSSRIAALRLMRKPYPKYPKGLMNSYSKHITLKERIKVFLGTCKRISKGVI